MPRHSAPPPTSISMASIAEFVSAMQQAVGDAFWRHRRLGETIVIFREGKIVKLTGDEIPVDEETNRRNEAQRRGDLTD